MKFQAIVHAIAGGFDNEWAVNQPPNGGANGSESFNASSNIPLVKKELEKYINQNKLQNQLQVHLDKRGLVITLLSDKAYYDSGSAEMRPETKQILDHVTKFLKQNTNLIRVEGNTDNEPISTAQYPTNWELSTARATNVVRYMVETDGLQPERVSAAGYGQYRPRNKNDTPEHKQQNRRVDIVLLNANVANVEESK